MVVRISKIDQFGTITLQFYDSDEVPLWDKMVANKFDKDQVSI